MSHSPYRSHRSGDQISRSRECDKGVFVTPLSIGANLEDSFESFLGLLLKVFIMDVHLHVFSDCDQSECGESIQPNTTKGNYNLTLCHSHAHVDSQ